MIGNIFLLTFALVTGIVSKIFILTIVPITDTGNKHVFELIPTELFIAAKLEKPRCKSNPSVYFCFK